MLHWTPETFWNSTPREFFLACEAYREAQEAKNPKQGGGLKDSEVAELKGMLKAEREGRLREWLEQ